MGRLVINGDEIYELDEECLKEKRRKNTKENRCCISQERQTEKQRNGAPKMW